MKDKSRFITFLRYLSKIIPGNYLKTVVYLNFIKKPRTFLQLSLSSFYRIDHIYDVLKEVKTTYKGNFSILEFGVADGYSLTKKLYAVKYLKMDDRVIVHGFDTFEGMPETFDDKDRNIISNDNWYKGQFKSSFESLDNYCRNKFKNYELHKGLFENTISTELLKSFEVYKPILIWIDCDYYTSSKVIFEKLVSHIPNGCVIYFDEPEFNYGSRFTGEARIIYEINNGKFGSGVELVLDSALSLNSQRVYRFINMNNKFRYERISSQRGVAEHRLRNNDSPFP
jgi:hypothetical protein